MPGIPFHRINVLRDEVIKWAAKQHEAELLEGVRCFMPQPSSEQEIRNALAFSILAPPPGEAALVVRFARQVGHRPRAERLWLGTWEQTIFGVMCLLDVEPGSWVQVHDVLGGRQLHVEERMGSQQLEVGDWFAGYYYRDGAQWRFEGSMQKLSSLAPIRAVQSALQALEAIAPGPDPRQVSPAQTHQLARPVLRAAQKALQPPRLVNADHHDILLVTALIGLPWAEVVEVLRAWPDARVESEAVHLSGEEPVDYLGGPAVRATFNLKDGEVTLFADSRERLDDMLRRWEAQTGRALPVVREDVQVVDSNLDGNELVFDSRQLTAPEELDPDEASRHLRATHQTKWLDSPLPVLGDQSPRQAVGVPRLAPLLWTLVHKQGGAALAHTLGMQLPAPE